MKNIALGVTGSIAAYRAVDITSELTKLGHCVTVILTADAQKFVTPLPFKTLSRQPVLTDLYSEDEGWKPSHIRVADEADLLLIAPATANTIAKLAHGLADDALSCTALSLNRGIPILVAPAMNGKMWQHSATQENVKKLTERGVVFIGPEEGLLACGYQGIGRLWNVQGILEKASELLSNGR